MSVTIMFPAYNEGENLALLLPKINAAMKEIEPDYEILVVDTMQPTDNTEQVAFENCAVYVRREGGNAYGDAIRTGFRRASKDYLLVMDADGSHSPDELKALLTDREKYDLTIGSRYVKGGKTDNPPVLIAMSKMVNIAFRLVLGIKAKDVSNSLRVYKTADVKDITPALLSDNFDLVEEILIRLIVKNKDLRIREVPITFNKRVHGESKRELLKFVFTYAVTLRRLLKVKRQARKEVKASK